jgi:hypothetical protein
MGRRGKEVPGIIKEDFIALLAGEFNRLGIKFKYDGHVLGSRQFVWQLFGIIMDVCCAATVASDRVSLAGLGAFWIHKGIFKFRASARYRRLIKGFYDDVVLADNMPEKFRQFLAYVKTQDSVKTKRQENVEFLTTIMGS